MTLKKTTEYALTILALMATRNKELYPAEYLYDELKIPRQYLRRLLTDLSKKGFITSIRGRNGGFVFARKLSEISFINVIEALEGPNSLNICLMGFTACILDNPCVMHDLWTVARAKMLEALTDTSLEDLREKYLKDSAHHHISTLAH